jgi:hypothetical protein
MKPINPKSVTPLYPMDYVCSTIQCPNVNLLSKFHNACTNCILFAPRIGQKKGLKHFLGVLYETNQS